MKQRLGIGYFLNPPTRRSTKEIWRNGEVWKVEERASKWGDNSSTWDMRTRRSNFMSRKFSVQNVLYIYIYINIFYYRQVPRSGRRGRESNEWQGLKRGRTRLKIGLRGIIRRGECPKVKFYVLEFFTAKRVKRKRAWWGSSAVSLYICGILGKWLSME
jgi:hypothetical protein